MARAIRFTRAERDAVAHALEDGPVSKGLASLLAKMDAASAPATPTADDFRACPPLEFARIAREELGDLVFWPPGAAAAYWAIIARDLKTQGVDAEGARRALAHVATWAKHTQELRALARNAARYLHESGARRKEGGDGPEGTAGRPPELR